ncbi:MAG: hypothetical protein ACI9JM_000304 [Halioglobus sp.]|jgi:hypothetical protein
MNIKKLSRFAAVFTGLAIGASSQALASSYAVSYNHILNLLVTSTDENGENGPLFIPLAAFTDFATLSSANAQVQGSGDPAHTANAAAGGGPVDALPAYGLNSIFPGADPANNNLVPLAQAGNYSRADSQVVSTSLNQLFPGLPVVLTGDTIRAWGVADAFISVDGFANALSLNGAESGFNTQVVLTQPAILSFNFQADPYMEVEMGAASIGGSANANLEVTFSITSQGTNFFNWSPDGSPGGISNGTEVLDEENLNGSIEVTAPGAKVKYDPTNDSSSGTAAPGAVSSYSARSNVLPPGIYTLALDMSQNVNVRTSLDTRAALGDRVWEDLNADGIQDCSDDGDGIIGGPGDVGPECNSGIPNVLVSLLLNPDGDASCTSGDEAPIDNTVTDLNGFYEFIELDPDVNYCVLFDQPSANTQLLCNDITNPGVGAQFSPADQGGMEDVDSDANINTGQTGNIDLSAQQFDRTWDAGLYCPAKIGDTLIMDSDRDGIQDPGELGVENQLVELIECIGGNQANVIDTTTTDSAGMYMFNPLPAGEYAVRFSKPADTVFSGQDQGGDDALDCDTDMNGVTDCVNLAPREYNSTIDACVNLPVAGLGDRVWEDTDADGVQDLGEDGIPGVTVNLLDAGGDGECNTGDENQLDTTLTAANGFYQFVDLDPSRYCVEFVKPEICASIIGGESAFSPANQGADDAVDSDADQATGQTGNIDLSPGEFDWTNDGGVYCPAKIGDLVWRDTDENGLQDGGEAGVEGVTVNLFDCGDDNMSNTADDTLLDSTATAGDGMYMFNPLEPGNYFVQCIKPDGFEYSPQNQGGDDSLDSDADTTTGIAACTNLASNEYDSTWDCGLIEPPTGGGEGCTPGFWKQRQHFNAWLNPPYAPNTQFSDVFENAFPGKTLLQVLKQGGGGVKALGRHTVAALLNSATEDVSYDVGSPAGVIAAFNAVYPGSKGEYNALKNQFAGFNEQGCPINGKEFPSNL